MTWSKGTVTATITQATVYPVINGSSTIFSTKINSNNVSYVPPTRTNLAGIVTTSVWGQILSYPDALMSWSSFYEWRGTSPEILPNGQTSCHYHTGDEDPTMFLSSVPSATLPPQTTDPADPSGWLYTLVFDESFAINAQVQSEFPDVGPFHDCAPGSLPYGAQPFETVLFTTITLVC